MLVLRLFGNRLLYVCFRKFVLWNIIIKHTTALWLVKVPCRNEHKLGRQELS